MSESRHIIVEGSSDVSFLYSAFDALGLHNLVESGNVIVHTSSIIDLPGSGQKEKILSVLGSGHIVDPSKLICFIDTDWEIFNSEAADYCASLGDCCFSTDGHSMESYLMEKDIILEVLLESVSGKIANCVRTTYESSWSNLIYACQFLTSLYRTQFYGNLRWSKLTGAVKGNCFVVVSGVASLSEAELWRNLQSYGHVVGSPVAVTLLDPACNPLKTHGHLTVKVLYEFLHAIVIHCAKASGEATAGKKYASLGIQGLTISLTSKFWRSNRFREHPLLKSIFDQFICTPN